MILCLPEKEVTPYLRSRVMPLFTILLVVYSGNEEINSQSQDKVLTLTNDHKQRVHQLVVEQTREWSDMVMRQVTEEHDAKKEHIVQQNECLRKLLQAAQQEQLKELEVKQERYVV